MASPTDTSAAAITRMKMNMICPSGCPHFEPAAMKASPAAFSMISMDRRMKIMLRLASTPARPIAKSRAAKIKPYSAGTLVTKSHLLYLRSISLALAEVVGTDKPGRQQE